MPTINKTRVQTSDYAELTRGFQLGKGGSERVIPLGYEYRRTLFDFHPQILAWKLNGNTNFFFKAGILGPSYAVQTFMEGSYRTDGAASGAFSATVTGYESGGTKDKVTGGLWVGAGIGVNIWFKAEEWKVHWECSGWKNSNCKLVGGWEGIGEYNFTPYIDLVGLVFTIIEQLISRSGKGASKKVDAGGVLGSIPTGLDFTDTKIGDLAAQNKAVLEPQFTLRFNILPYIPYVGNLINALSKVGGDVSAGPLLRLVLPITVSTENVGVGGAFFNNLRVSGGQLIGDRAGSSGNVARFRQKLDFQVRAGLFASISILKIFDIGAEFDVPVFTLPVAEVVNELYPSWSVASASAPLQGPRPNAGRVQVIFDKPLPVGA